MQESRCAITQITNYQSLSVPAGDDLLVVVDVSDTAMSPEGTTKNIQVQNLTSFVPSGAAFSASDSAGGVLSVTNTHSAPTNASTELVAAAAGDKTLGLEVAGDSFNRLAADSNGKLGWGTGAATQDTILQRASGGGLTTTNPDGNTYDIQRLSLIASGMPQTVSSNSFITVTGLFANVAIGTYRVHGVLLCVQGTTAAGQAFQLSGTATASTVWVKLGLAQESSGSVSESVFQNAFTALNASYVSFAFPAGVSFNIEIDGYVTFSAAGSFNFQVAEGVSGDNFKVIAGWLDLLPVI